MSSPPGSVSAQLLAEAEHLQRRTLAPRKVLVVASLGVFMAFVDATIVNVAFPSIERSFPHASLAGLSWVINAYNIVFAALMVAAGRIADLVGRRRVFRVGLVLFSLASAACAAAPTPVVLVLSRIAQALGAAILVPCSLALVLQAFEAERRPHAVALWSASAAVAAGVGPALGGALVSAGNWRLAFLVNVPIGVAAHRLAGRVLVESRMSGRRRLPDLLGALTLAVGVGALTLAIVQGPRWGWADARVVAALLIAALLLGAVVYRSAHHRVPVIELELVRIRNVAMGTLAMLLTGAGMFGYMLCNILFLTSVWHYSVLAAGLAITPGPIVAALLARPFSELAERIGYRITVLAGALVWASGLAWFIARVGARPDFIGEWLPGMLLLGLGAAIAFPNISSAAVTAAPGEQFATVTAFTAVARQLGAALGVAVVVAVIGTPARAHALVAFDHGWWFGVACFAAVASSATALSRVRPRAITPPDHKPAGCTLGPGAAEVPRAWTPVPRAPRVRSAASPAEFLRAAPLFAEVPDPVLSRIVSRAQRVRVRAGDWLFKEGDPSDSLYLVRSGRLEVTKDGAPVPVELGRGAVVGELGVLTKAPRSASVRARRDCELLQITSEDFSTLMAISTELATVLARTVSAQLQVLLGTPPARRPVPATIAVVPLQRDLPATNVALALIRALSATGSARIGELATGHDTLAEFGALVDRWEEESDHVVLRTGCVERLDPWSAFALERADRVLALTSGGDIPGWLADRAMLHGCELVGIDIAPGSGALSKWITALEPSGIHLLERGEGSTDSIALLARRLTGRSLGIVLSGGGARAFAHLGVLETLLDAGLRIDRVAGVSMGAYIGAQLAAGRGIDEIDARCYEEWVRRNPINDYTLPRRALIRGEKTHAMCRRTFGELSIEELPRPFYCASTDLRRGELVLHRHGPLAASIVASMALPILAPAQMLDGRALIDGSMLDNLPVAPMAQTGEGPVLAVDIKPRADRSSSKAPGPRRAPSVPALGETFARVLQLATADTSRAAEHADAVIRVGVDGVGLLEFHQIDAARDAGRRAAERFLARELAPA